MTDLDNAKTGKANEALARKFFELADPYRWSVKPEALQEALLIYKCLSRAISQFTGKNGLPQFITEQSTRMGTAIISNVSRNTLQMDYPTFIDTFQYTTTLYVESMNKASFLVLNHLIQDNPIPLTLTYNLNTPSKFISIVDSHNLCSILFAESIKLELPPETSFTLMELHLSEKYDKQKHSTDIPDLVSLISTLSDIIQPKLEATIALNHGTATNP